MKNTMQKIGVAFMAIVIITNLVSCVATQPHQNQGGYYPPQQQSPYMGAPQSGYPMTTDCGPQGQRLSQQRGGPRSQNYTGTGGPPPVPSNMPGTRWSNWKNDGVLKEDWHYDPKTGKVTKKGQQQFNANDPALRQHMEADGVELFPNTIPVGGEMPPGMATGKKRPSGSSMNNGPTTPRRPGPPPLPPAKVEENSLRQSDTFDTPPGRTTA